MAQPHQQQVDRNFEAFRKVLPDLLKTHPGKYALMHDAKVVEFFDSLSDAVRYGHATFGDLDFSVQEVTTQEVTLGFHTYALYQLSA